MASQAAGSEGPASGETGLGAPLVGNVGQEFVQLVLSTNDPVTAIAEIQSRGAIQDTRCRPLLGLLDYLGFSRAEAHKEVVKRATDALLARIPDLPQDTLLRLLEETFPFVGISDLRAVPLAVLERLQPVPATFLKQLAVDRELFWELPPSVQRQAWELDRKLLQSQALSLVAAYTYETATWMQALNVDEALQQDRNGDAEAFQRDHDATKAPPTQMSGLGQQGPEGASPTARLPAEALRMPQLQRRALRNGSAALRRLTAMVGSSPVVYRGIIDICTARYRESDAPFIGMKEAAFCALRSQLLMSLHDARETALCAAEPCHKLAWTLDACLKDRRIDDRRLAELRNFFKPYEALHARRQRARVGNKRPRSAGHRSTDRDDDAESAGVPGAAAASEDPLQHLGAAGMILRDPTVFHLLLHHVLRRLRHCVDAQEVPGEDEKLIFVTRLLMLAVSVRAMLRTREFHLPPASHEIMGTLYPSIADLMLEAELRRVEGEFAHGSAEEEASLSIVAAPHSLVSLLDHDEISRRVVQTYALERLQAGDVLSAQPALAAVSRGISALSSVAVPEFAPFAFTLARRVTGLLAAGRIKPAGACWRLAVDEVLLRLVDSETEVHEEVLRLLLAAAPSLNVHLLGRYLAAALNNSRRSRKAHAKRGGEVEGLPSFMSADFLLMRTSSLASNGYSLDGAGTYGSRGAGGSGSGRGAGTPTDGVRATYALFLNRKPELNHDSAPELFRYLETDDE